MAHEKYKDTIEGFKPEQIKHETFVDLEPVSKNEKDVLFIDMCICIL